jgi:hypothetical protein
MLNKKILPNLSPREALDFIVGNRNPDYPIEIVAKLGGATTTLMIDADELIRLLYREHQRQECATPLRINQLDQHVKLRLNPFESPSFHRFE